MNLKKPATFDEQIKILSTKHHMKVENPEEAKEFLSYSNYYRFTGYAISFRQDKSGETFYPNTNFNAVKSIYLFDEELRSLLHRYLEKVEIFARTQISYWFSLQRNTKPPYMAHYNEKQFKNRKQIQEIYACLEKEEDRNSDSLVVQHHKIKYGDRMPLWVMVGLLSFSNLSKLYNCMYDSEKESIAVGMHTLPSVLRNHLYCLSKLRNKCAHYSRLYGSDVCFNPPIKLPRSFLSRHSEIKNNTLFAYLLALIQRQPTAKDKECLSGGLISLIKSYENIISLEQIGAPNNYVSILEPFR